MLSQATSFSSVPMGSIVMRIRSPLASVNELAAQSQCPSSESTRCGNELSRRRIFDQRLWVAFQLRQRDRARELDPAHDARISIDNLGRMRQRTCAHQNSRSERATAVVHLGLRQIERILALDVARTHVVADGVAGDVSSGADQQG